MKEDFLEIVAVIVMEMSESDEAAGPRDRGIIEDLVERSEEHTSELQSQR